MIEDVTRVSTLENIRELVCYNQLQLSQYSVLASLKHRSLREHLLEPQKRDLLGLVEDLELYLDDKFNEVFIGNCKRVVTNFLERPNFPLPRLSLKIIADDDIIPLYRFPDEPYDDIASKANENTAFIHILKGAECFISNNIPLDYFCDRYQNKRLKKDKNTTKTYLNYLQEKEVSPEVRDELWRQCWKNPFHNTSDKKILSDNNYYRSTLVVPLSLKSADLDQAFKKRFQVESKEIGSRIIYGFLCVDNFKEDFFEPNIDYVNILYITADLLSLYMIEQLMKTQFSPVYFKALKLLGVKK